VLSGTVLHGAEKGTFSSPYEVYEFVKVKCLCTPKALRTVPGILSVLNKCPPGLSPGHWIYHGEDPTTPFPNLTMAKL
jgi:hypothetical protein